MPDLDHGRRARMASRGRAGRHGGAGRRADGGRGRRGGRWHSAPGGAVWITLLAAPGDPRRWRCCRCASGSRGAALDRFAARRCGSSGRTTSMLPRQAGRHPLEARWREARPTGWRSASASTCAPQGEAAGAAPRWRRPRGSTCWTRCCPRCAPRGRRRAARTTRSSQAFAARDLLRGRRMRTPRPRHRHRHRAGRRAARRDGAEGVQPVTLAPDRSPSRRRMILFVDVGNTETTLGLFEGSALRGHWRVMTDTRARRRVRAGAARAAAPRGVAHGRDWCRARRSARWCPAMTRRCARRRAHWRRAAARHRRARAAAHPLDVDEPLTVGADRVINTLAASRASGATVSWWTWGRPRPSTASPPTGSFPGRRHRARRAHLGRDAVPAHGQAAGHGAGGAGRG
jgi:hypothetical protein